VKEKTVKKPARVEYAKLADDNHAVVSVSGTGGHCNSPCRQCPWRKDAVGVFPAEAFRISAHTSYDAAMEEFGCHSSTPQAPKTCAGYLLRGGDENLGTRLRAARGELHYDQLDDRGLELFDSYREMAIANGVGEDDPVLEKCEPEHGHTYLEQRLAEMHARRKKEQF
jgi:hypothetical protein